jgi:hypothetical protein
VMDKDGSAQMLFGDDLKDSHGCFQSMKYVTFYHIILLCHTFSTGNSSGKAL